MKRCMALILFLLPALALAKPALKFKNTTFDFGEVSSGKTIDIAFEFENAGDQLLVIRNIIPACGCTTAELPKKEYKPGERGVIQGKFNTSGYRGKIVKTITVTSNDNAAPEVRLAISGTIVVKDFAQADVKPEHIPFGAVKAGKPYTRKLNLSNLGNLDLRILEFSCSPEVSMEFKTNSVPGKGSTEITLTFTPFDKGVFNNLVKIRTNDYRTPYAFVRLEAQVE